jgi:hypothetical protein
MEGKELKLRDKLREWLLLGPDMDMDRGMHAGTDAGADAGGIGVASSEDWRRHARAAATIQTGRALMAQWEALLGQRNKNQTDLLALKETINDSIRCSRREEIIAGIQQLSHKTVETKLAKIVAAFSELERCTTLEDISSCITALLRLRLPTVPRGLALKKYVLARSESMRSIQLGKFHDLFESHLKSTLQSNVSNAVAESLWVQFIANSRDILVSFMLISLVPFAMFESSDMVVEKFQESLDSALTPMWGRFYFHLSVVRDIGSMSQLVWSFGYAKSFVGLLRNLFAVFAEEALLGQILSFDYHHASGEQITDKAIKFMRAHVAMLVSKLAFPVAEQTCAVLVEQILDLDQSLLQNAPQYIENSVYAVIKDSSTLQLQWIHLETQFFMTLVREAFSSKEPFQVAYFGMPTDVETVGPSTSTQCYYSLHEIVRLLATSTNRYQFLPKKTQMVLTSSILEPLILAAVGSMVLLIKLRFSSSSTSSAVHLTELIGSMTYFSSSMSTLPTDRIRCSAGGYLNKWNQLHEWISRHEHLELQSLTALLVSQCFEVTSDVEEMDGRDDPMSTLSVEAVGIGCAQMSALGSVMRKRVGI